MSLTSFSNRRALIVGGTSGIGRATAIALARLGSSVVVIGLDSTDFSDLMEGLPNDSRIGQPEIQTIVADVISSEQWSRAFNSAVSLLEGRVDIFVSTV
ncbi:MAG: short chain dehydrogenase, partial [Planctomycetota bacterium]